MFNFNIGKILLLIAHSDIAAEGITLTKSKFVYVWQAPYLPSVIIQMAGRCARLGQKDRVEVEVLLADAVVEQEKVCIMS